MPTKNSTVRSTLIKMAKRKTGVTSTQAQERTGASRATVSAALTELRNAGLIGYGGIKKSTVTGRMQNVYTKYTPAFPILSKSF